MFEPPEGLIRFTEQDGASRGEGRYQQIFRPSVAVYQPNGRFYIYSIFTNYQIKLFEFYIFNVPASIAFGKRLRGSGKSAAFV